MRIILISVFIIASISLLLVSGLVFPNLFPAIGSFSDSPSDALALAQLAVEVASLAALVFAAWEFLQSRQKPELQVWIQPVRENSEFGSPMKISTVNWERSGFDQAQGGIIYAFRFKILLGNVGRAAGRHIKVSLHLGNRTGIVPRDPVRTEFIRQTENPAAGRWVPSSLPQHSDSHVFHGGDDLIAYVNPGETSITREFLDELGEFTIFVPVFRDDNVNVQQTLICNLYADGMNMRTEELVFRLRD